MDKRGFYFKSKNNEYFYDDITGMVSCENNKNSNKILYGNNVYKEKNISSKEIENTLTSMDTTQLTLIVTEECNLRCKYCIFSGIYDNNRTHANNYMSIDVAKKAIDTYLKKAEVSRKKNIIFRPTIGFFGGEPLLNFNLIKLSIEYAESIYNSKINYTITTNATLLDEKKIDFLAEKNIFLVISLNGDKLENDRLRVYKNNTGTFETIMEQIELISKKYPKYFDSRVRIAATFDNATDMLNLRNFFENNPLVKDKLSILSKVVSLHTDWYKQYSNEQNKNHKAQINELKEEFIIKLYNNQEIDLILKRLFVLPYFNILNRCINVDIKDAKPAIQPFSGSCVPSNKITVDHTGLLHMCEKINAKIPYGNIDEWINYEKLADVINKYNNYLGSSCINCPIQRLCQVCYNDLIDSQGTFNFNPENLCEILINEQIRLFSEVYSLLESGISMSDLKNKLI